MVSEDDQTTASPIPAGLLTLAKICLANYYSFVIIRSTYEKNVLFLWRHAGMARSAGRMRMFDILYR
jgi:hypothetical protein